MIKPPRARRQKTEGKNELNKERRERERSRRRISEKQCQRYDGETREDKRDRGRDETAHKAEGVIENGAVIQSSQDAVMKLPLSSILSAWHGQLPAPPELSKKLCCISD